MISLHTAQRLSQENSEITLTRADKHFLKKWEKVIDNEILTACNTNEQSLLIKRLCVFDKGSYNVSTNSKKYLKYKKRFELFVALLDKYKVQGYKVSYTGATYDGYWDFDTYILYDYRLRGIITNLKFKWDKDYNPLSSTKDEINDLIEKYEK